MERNKVTFLKERNFQERAQKHAEFLENQFAQNPKNFEVLCFTNGSTMIPQLDPVTCASIKKQQFSDVMKERRVKGFKTGGDPLSYRTDHGCDDGCGRSESESHCEAGSRT